MYWERERKRGKKKMVVEQQRASMCVAFITEFSWVSFINFEALWLILKFCSKLGTYGRFSMTPVSMLLKISKNIISKCVKDFKAIEESLSISQRYFFLFRFALAHWKYIDIEYIVAIHKNINGNLLTILMHDNDIVLYFMLSGLFSLLHNLIRLMHS